MPEDMFEAMDKPLTGASKHLMVCCGPRCNSEDVNEAHYRAFCSKLQAAGKSEGVGRVMVTPVDCTGICAGGTCAYVLPDKIYYHEIEDEAAVDRVVNEHLVGGTPVDDLVLEGHKPE